MKLALDKQGHIWAGLAIVQGVGLLTGSMTAGFVVAAIAAAIRELRGNMDAIDYAATLAGAGLGVLILAVGLP